MGCEVGVGYRLDYSEVSLWLRLDVGLKSDWGVELGRDVHRGSLRLA